MLKLRSKRSKLSMAVCLSALITLVAYAAHSVGNGGDPLPIVFLEAQERASNILPTLKDTHFRPDNELSDDEKKAKAFILANKIALAADIKASKHIWHDDDKTPPPFPRCAFTNRDDTNNPNDKLSDVHFYFKKCGEFIKTRQDAFQMIIHEATHHFGVGGTNDEERFADRVGYMAYSAWQKSENDFRPRWDGIETSPLETRAFQSAVWSGYTKNKLTDYQLLVWGGCAGKSAIVDCTEFLGNGARYDLKENTWKTMEMSGAPSARMHHTAVWTGHGKTGLPDDPLKDVSLKMIVWGGCSGDAYLCSKTHSDGGIYDPINDSWMPIPESSAAPLARVYHSATWVGDKMMIWGGEENFENPNPAMRKESNKGAFFNPMKSGDAAWEMIDSTLANTPEERKFHTAIFTGEGNKDSKLDNKVIIWGGCNDPKMVFSCVKPLASGAIFDPVKKTWETIELPGNLLKARYGHSAIWTGERLVIWGGRGVGGVFLKDGAMYDPTAPSTKRWKAISSTGPTARAGHTATWTGTKMIIWGGSYKLGGIDTYPVDYGEWTPDPEYKTDGIWRKSNAPNAAYEARTNFGAIWTGENLLIWGGEGKDGEFLDSGALYYSYIE